MAFTGRDFTAEEALRMGLINEVYENREALMAGALALAAEIAENAAPAVRGSKRILAYMEDHSVDDGLKYVAAWNSAFLNAREIQEALQRAMEKKAKKALTPETPFAETHGKNHGEHSEEQNGDHRRAQGGGDQAERRMQIKRICR